MPGHGEHGVERWRDGGEEDSGTNTLPTWRPEDLREMAGLWKVEKKAAWSLEMLRVKAPTIPPRSTKLHLTLCQSKGLPLLKISKSIIMKYNYKSIPDETYDHVIAAHIRNNPHY